jgi:GPI ethanolamine phosphate transferase 3 subunit O
MEILRNILFLISLYLYLDGFFLTKRELSQTSTINSSNFGSSEQFPHLRIQKVFFLIVDALRYDFVVPKKNCDQCASKLTIIHRLLEQNASQCFLAAFRADPPTTTSQRLRGLMTGSLPTFVEIGSNFQSTAVLEDSLIQQWRSDGKRLALLGDDTWELLFPNQFEHSFPFDSFNTRDIDTVDNGILDHLWELYPTNRSPGPGWDILIAHFLGVDHIGHTFHAHHPLMGERLELMNEVLEKAIEALPDDALLVFMGDHGMTDQGEHGVTPPLSSTTH